MWFALVLRLAGGTTRERLYSAGRWLGGEMADAGLAPRGSRYRESPNNRKHCMANGRCTPSFSSSTTHHFTVPVVAFDEAEQGLGVDKRRKDKIFSVLQSEINAIADLKDASALLVYAFTPDMLEDMHEFACVTAACQRPRPWHGVLRRQRVCPGDQADRSESTRLPSSSTSESASPSCCLTKLGWMSRRIATECSRLSKSLRARLHDPTRVLAIGVQ